MGTFNTGSYTKPQIGGFSEHDYYDEYSDGSHIDSYQVSIPLPFFNGDGYVHMTIDSDYFMGYYDGLYINHMITLEIDLDSDYFNIDFCINLEHDCKRENEDFYSIDLDYFFGELVNVLNYYQLTSSFIFDIDLIVRMVDRQLTKHFCRFNVKNILPITNITEFGGWSAGIGTINENGEYR